MTQPAPLSLTPEGEEILQQLQARGAEFRALRSHAIEQAGLQDQPDEGFELIDRLLAAFAHLGVPWPPDPDTAALLIFMLASYDAIQDSLMPALCVDHAHITLHTTQTYRLVLARLTAL